MIYFLNSKSASDCIVSLTAVPQTLVLLAFKEAPIHLLYDLKTARTANHTCALNPFLTKNVLLRMLTAVNRLAAKWCSGTSEVACFCTNVTVWIDSLSRHVWDSLPMLVKRVTTFPYIEKPETPILISLHLDIFVLWTYHFGTFTVHWQKVFNLSKFDHTRRKKMFWGQLQAR